MKNAMIAIVVLVLIGGATFYVIQQNKKNKAASKAVKKNQTDPNAFKVALVTPGAQDDKGWNENARKALDKIKAELKAETYARAVKGGSSVEAHAAFNNFAGDKKVNVIIGHAGEWNDAKTAEIAAKYKDTIFLISGSEKTENNVVGVRFVLEDATYVLGQLAALMSKSGTIACVGPVKLPVIESTFYAFEEGAKSVKPDIKVKIVWTESFEDHVRAKEQTLQLIGEGADFIFHNANNGAKGIFEAVQEQKAKGVLAFGSNDDQALTMPNFADIILASATLDIPNAYTKIAAQIKRKSSRIRLKILTWPAAMLAWHSIRRSNRKSRLMSGK